ncbi:MAG: outer membrane protein assembly factor BamA [FCB group bacterium]|nr:outer membrane protein assembly factor BamA [FCB group bacterium]
MIKRRAGIALFLLISLISIADIIQAQENYNIVDVVVEGNRVASKSLILGVSSLEIGTPLTATNTAETIRRLYGLGIFSDIRIEAEPVNGGLKVYIIVKELPKLSNLEFEGNKKIKTSELKDKLNLGVGGYISPYLINRGENEIKDLYAKKGYFQAEVVPTVIYGKDSSSAVLKYRINEKSKVKVEKVVLIGNVRVPASKLIKKMRNRKRGFLKSSDFAQDKFDDDLEKVINEYHRLGYIDAYMISDSTSISKETNRMTIYLHVYEGPEYYFGKVTFKNNKEIPTTVLKKQLKFKEGQVFDADKYDESLQEIYSVYYDIGHLHINIIDNRTTRADSIIDISYDISEGLPSNIHFVKIVGNTKTKDKVIRRELKTFPGQKFNRAILIRSIRDVMALNYFTNVVPTPLNLPNGDVDIEYKVEEKQTGQISAGAGYNSQDKLVGNLGMGIPNFRGNGQNLNFSIDFGSRRNSFSLSFTEPWLFGRPTLLGVDFYTLNRRWFSDYTEGRGGGSIKLGRRLRWPDNFFRIFGSYRLERDRYYDFDDAFKANNSYKTSYWYDKPGNATTFDYLLGQTTHEPYPGSILAYNEAWLTSSQSSQISLTISRDSRNLPEFATSGSQITYTFEKIGGFLGGFWDYQKHMLTAAKFIPLFWKFTLAAKVQYGVITSSSGDDSKILLSERFTPGGTAYDGIVRGYDDGVLTPDSLITQSDTAYIYHDSTALVGIDPPDSIVVTNGSYTRVRGNYMLVSNIELQFPIVEHQIYTLLFFDAGNSWLHRKDIKPFTGLYKGVGAGFRIVVPGIGTIGFDFGYALDEIRGSKKGWKPHFQIGTTFR